MAKWFLLCSTLLAASLGVCATAQPAATIDPKSWLTPEAPIGDGSLPVQTVPGVIVPEGTRPVAAGLLIKTQIVELSYAEARLLGIDPRNILGTAGATPFLARGVSPNNAGTCNANLQGNVLSVFCGSLGDFNYELRPVIVFLHRKPSSVQISAMTAR
jgi:hypothetical protein